MQIMELRRILAANVKGRRRHFGWTQPELEKKSGVAQSHVSRIERGESAATIDTVARFAHAFGCSPIDLLRTQGTALESTSIDEPLPLPPPVGIDRPAKRIAHRKARK